MEFLNFDWCGKHLKLQLSVGVFCTGNMAILLYDWSDGWPEPWHHLAVNTYLACPENCTLINTNPLGEEILTWVTEQRLGVPTGRYAHSGYCTYLEYRFDPQILQRLDPDGYSKYIQYRNQD